MDHGTERNANGEVVSTWKTFNDPIHGHVKIFDICVKVIDTPQFQRLREIKQLGAVPYVFASANHTRFEHSVGTCHLSRLVVKEFAENQPSLAIEALDIDAVALAGLCHDVGHGCFSHVLDNEIIPSLNSGYNKHHEERGVEVLQYLIDTNNLDIDEDVVKAAKGYILAGEHAGLREKPFLWDIVANSKTGIDVDKFDYLARDSYFCGVKTSFDHRRTMGMMRVVNDEICFKHREAETAYDLFLMRSKMHSTVYTHKTVKAIEYMIVDALKAANPVLQFAESIGDIRQFCKLDDTILKEIERSDHPGLAASQEIIQRLRRRELYRFVDEFVIPSDQEANFKKITSEDICEHKSQGDSFSPEDIIVQHLKIDFGKDTSNPIDSVKFWQKLTDTEGFTIKRGSISNILPANYRDIKVRVFTRQRGSKIEEAINLAFRKLTRNRFGEEFQRTPSIKKRQWNDILGAGSLADDHPHAGGARRKL